MKTSRLALLVAAPVALIAVGVVLATTLVARRRTEPHLLTAAEEKSLPADAEVSEASEIAAIAETMAAEGGTVTIEEVSPRADGSALVSETVSIVEPT
ncbi:MAG TPA: hypothetical protein VF407_01420 [Polyangiaceae bacterium]